MKRLIPALLVAGLLATTGVAGAITSGPDQGVTAFSGYPANEMQEGCSSANVHGVTVQLNGDAPVSDAQTLRDFVVSDVLTVRWTSVDPACVGETIAASLKEAQSGSFDASIDQRLLLPFEYAITTAGPGSLIFPISQPVGDVCFYQFDTTLGRPLSVVGPDGNYYSGSYGGSVTRSDERSVLLAASNGEIPDCLPSPTTTSTTALSSTTSTTSATTSTTAVSDSTTSTSSPPTSTSTTPPTSSTQMTSTTLSDASTTSTVGTVIDTTTVASRPPLAGPSGSSMPVTGANVALVAGLATILIVAGMLLRAMYKRPETR